MDLSCWRPLRRRGTTSLWTCSPAATSPGPDYEGRWFHKALQALLKVAEELALRFRDLRERDEAAFARRAANILTQVPAYAIDSYDRLLRTNGFARLLFVRSFGAYLAVPEAVRDLVEASEVHVQMLAYRVLAQDDDRARRSLSSASTSSWGPCSGRSTARLVWRPSGRS